MNVNDAFLKLTEISREDVVGKNAVAPGIWSEEQRSVIVAHLRATSPAKFEVPYRMKSGRSLTLIITSAPSDFGEKQCLVNVATDITNRLAKEEAGFAPYREG